MLEWQKNRRLYKRNRGLMADYDVSFRTPRTTVGDLTATSGAGGYNKATGTRGADDDTFITPISHVTLGRTLSGCCFALLALR